MHKHKYWREQQWQQHAKNRIYNGTYWTNVRYIWKENGEVFTEWYQPPLHKCKAVRYSYRGNSRCHANLKKVSSKKVRQTTDLLQGNMYRKAYDLWWNEW